MSEIVTWKLSQEELSASIEKLRKINARAAKKGMASRYTWTKGEPVTRTLFDPDTDIKIGVEVLTPLTVMGEAPSFGGWTFTATLANEGGVLVTRTAPGFEGVIDRSTIVEGYCSHCKTLRHRNDTYLLTNAETGETMQVGSTCIKDFLGHGFTPSFLSMLDTKDLDEMGGGFGGGQREFDVATTLALAIAATQRYGFVPASSFDRIPTKQVVVDYMTAGSRAGAEYRAEIGYVTAEHDAKAAAVVEWVKAQDAKSEYMINLQTVVSLNYISYRSIGLVVSAPAAFVRATQEKVEREAAPVSQYVGTVGEKVALTLTVKVVRYIEGQYGVTTLLIFADAAGNSFKWFASGVHEVEVGQVVELKGTIKDHETYNEVRSTQLTRCKMVSIVSDETCASV